MSAGKIMDLLKGCEHFDKDNRFMAAMDLCAEVVRLSEQQKIEEALEKRICAAFIKHLDDVSLDVQTNAIKSIQTVAGIIKEQHLVMIIETLADKVIGDGKKDVRDVYSLAIRSIITQLHDLAASNMIRAIYPKLMKGLKMNQEEIKEESLDIMTEVFKNFSLLLIKQNNLVNKDDILMQVCEMLLIKSDVIRKKATICLGQFAIILNQRQLQKLVAILLDRVSKSDNKLDVLTQFQCISQITRCVGEKLRGNYDAIFNVLQFSFDCLKDDESVDLDNELAEASLLSIENLIRHCPENAVQTLKSIYKLTSKAITYDPNYNYDEDEMGQDQDMDDDEGWGDEYDGEDEAIDADDTAWKVRKGSIRVIDAVIQSCPANLRDSWDDYINLLKGRFIERDDTVKCNILQAFQNLLKASVVISSDMPQGDMSMPSLVKSNSQMPSLSLQKKGSLSAEGHYGDIVRLLLKQYQSKNVKVKVAVMKTLSSVTLIMQDDLENHLAAIIPVILQSLAEKHNDITSYSLNILQQGFKNTEPTMVSQVAQKECESVIKFLLETMADKQSNISSEAFRVTGQFVLQLVAVDGAGQPEFASAYTTIYKCIFESLQQQNIAQEIKQTAIIAMAKLISVAHTILTQPQIDEVIKIYSDRLSGDWTRVSALRALALIATTENGVVQMQALPTATDRLVNLLHQAERQVQISTLETIYSLLSRYPGQLAAKAPAFQENTSKFLVDKDIQRASLAIKCCRLLLKLNKNMQENFIALEQCVQLAGSQQILPNQQIVANLNQFFREACAQGIINTQVIDQLILQVTLSTRSSALMAAVVIQSNDQLKSTYITNMFKVLTNPSKEEQLVQTALCLGEVGVFVDLSKMNGIIETLSKLFQHPDDQVRQASAIALGGISIGNTEFFIPQVFTLINKSETDHKYMYFSTIKEIIVNKPDCLKNYLGDLMPLYFSQTDTDNEAIRNIVAESIGKLFITFPANIAPYLDQALKSPDMGMQITCTKSFKYSAHSGNEAANFKPFIETLLSKIGGQAEKDSPQLTLKEYALDSIGQIIYNQYLGNLMKPYADALVKQALEETPVKKELIKTVDLGPFKHTVDTGVPIRKAAYNVLQNLLSKFQVLPMEIIDAVINGFSDPNDDVQMICFGFMIKLIQNFPMIVINKLDTMVEKFNMFYAKISPKFKNNSQSEREQNLMRSILRVTEALQRNPESMNNQAFQAWFNLCILENVDIPLIRELYEKISSSSSQFTV